MNGAQRTATHNKTTKLRDYRAGHGSLSFHLGFSIGLFKDALKQSRPALYRKSTPDTWLNGARYIGTKPSRFIYSQGGQTAGADSGLNVAAVAVARTPCRMLHKQLTVLSTVTPWFSNLFFLEFSTKPLTIQQNTIESKVYRTPSRNRMNLSSIYSTAFQIH